MNLDSLGVKEALDKFTDQVKVCYEQAFASNIEKVDCENVLISGMGGSSNAAKLIQGLYEADLNIPIFPYNDYGLPAWVNNKTLVISNSYSGNTEENLSTIEAAQKIGASVIGVATAGKIAQMITEGSIKGAIINPGDTNPTRFPKTGLGVSLGGLFGALTKAGVLPNVDKELELALEEVSEVKKTWGVKETAEFLHGASPVLFCGRPFLGALNAGRNAMCEISRNFTQFYEFPEVNHVLIEATQKPEIVKNNFKYLFFESQFLHDRIKLRYEITKDIFSRQGLSTKSYVLSTTTKLSQALELAYFCANVAYELSMLDNTDPGPEPWIIELKTKLSQPVH
ncbi:MAG TPA: SIS domain-containing protein [Patescibacteria group bacterium]|nr:SIS domain-containing protein [Patescibacteria group bacterium]